jgi:hypothetical protein
MAGILQLTLEYSRLTRFTILNGWKERTFNL